MTIDKLVLLIELVKSALSDKGFDGLYSSEGCACERDDLMPCGSPQPDCVAGVKADCDGSCDDGKCDFHIVPRKSEDEP